MASPQVRNPTVKHQPSYTLRKKFEPANPVMLNPGPGAYDTAGGPGAMGYSLSKSNRQLHATNKLPGPGSYETDVTSNTAPAYRMNGRPDMYGKNAVPGPGSYEALPVHEKARRPLFGTSQRPGVKSQVPGPGSYTTDHLTDLNQSPGRSGMAKAHRRFHSNSDVPGPGEYQGDAVHARAPAYSLKKRPDMYGKSPNPGPGSYEIPEKPLGKDFAFGNSKRPDIKAPVPGPGQYENSLSATQPGYSYARSTRKLHSYSEVPGPGSYGSQTIDTGAKGYKMNGKYDSYKQKNVPGPGEYGADSALIGIKEKAPAYGFGEKRVSKYSQVPGPGSYEYDSPNHGPGKSNKFGNSRRPGVGNIVPGPGAYDANSNSQTQLGQFSKSPRRHIAYGKHIEVGPGSYEYNDPGKPNAVKSTLMARRDKDPATIAPGPGAYDNHEVTKLGAKPGGYSLGNSGRTDFTKTRKAIPGPGEYIDPDKKQQPGYALDRGRRPDVEAPKRYLPGPGAYDSPTHKPKEKGYTMGGHQAVINSSKNNPGPGNYEQNVSVLQKKAPGYKLGSSKRPEIKSNVPGAGQYDTSDKTKPAAPAYAVGQSPRFKVKEKPDVGFYNIPPTL